MAARSVPFAYCHHAATSAPSWYAMSVSAVSRSGDASGKLVRASSGGGLGSSGTLLNVGVPRSVTPETLSPGPNTASPCGPPSYASFTGSPNPLTPSVEICAYRA